METLTQFTSFIMESIFPHWPGIFFVFLITILAQTLKTRVFTKELALKYKFIFWGRRIYPVVLLLLGIFPGLLWPGEVYPSIDTAIEKIFYFMGCSGISILGFNIFKQWVKKKYDLDIEEDPDETILGVGEETSGKTIITVSGDTVCLAGGEVREGKDNPAKVPFASIKGEEEKPRG